MQPRHRPGIIFALALKPVTGETAETDDHARMLDPPVRIKQTRTDNSCVRIFKARHHLAQPTGVDDFDVVVEQKDEFAGRQRDAAIDLPREIKGRRLDLGFERSATFAGLGVEIEHARVGRPIVDDDDFKIRIVGACRSDPPAPARSAQTNPYSE